MARRAKLALFKLKNRFGVGCVGAVAHRALAGLERDMRHLILEELALLGMAHQAKIRNSRGDGKGSL